MPSLRVVFAVALVGLGSVSSRECLDAPAILATFTAGHGFGCMSVTSLQF